MTPIQNDWLPIRTPRLILRDFRADDLDAIQAYARDPEVARFMVWGPNPLEQTREYLDLTLASQGEWPRFAFNLTIEHAGSAAGSIALRLADSANRIADFGYCLRRDLWGQGLVTEAARALVETAFGVLGLHRLFATCDVRNGASFAVMEKLGMRREGHMRGDRFIKGEWRDTYLYAILASEWPRPPGDSAASRVDAASSAA